jgi:PleD family two-component response regulator
MDALLYRSAGEGGKQNGIALRRRDRRPAMFADDRLIPRNFNQSQGALFADPGLPSVEQRSKPTGAVMRVVIIEDNETTMVLLRQLVSRADTVEAVTFSDPVEAVEKLADLDADLVLVDYLMPGMNGIEVITGIRRLAKHKSVPVVMITGENEREVRLEAFNAGATDFLNKPIEPIEFKARVRNLLALRRAEVAMRGLAA